ncbi:MAG: NAD(P)H-dependent oxidoreductase [Burkholderiaceae bacterium]
MTQKIGIVVGSLRKESTSRKLANALAELAPQDTTLTELAFGDLPLYNADLEGAEPGAWKRFRDEVAACDGVLFIIPEYNRSVPGGVKNALDVASKPMGRNLWVGKPVFVMAQSTGPLGGLAGSFALKQTLLGAGALALAHPEVYLGRVATLFEEGGALVPETKDFLRDALAKFAAWTARAAPR